LKNNTAKFHSNETFLGRIEERRPKAQQQEQQQQQDEYQHGISF